MAENNEIQANENTEIEAVEPKKIRKIGKTAATVGIAATGVGGLYLLGKKFLKPAIDKATVKQAKKIIRKQKLAEMEAELGETLDQYADAELAAEETEK